MLETLLDEASITAWPGDGFNSGREKPPWVIRPLGSVLSKKFSKGGRMKAAKSRRLNGRQETIPLRAMKVRLILHLDRGRVRLAFQSLAKASALLVNVTALLQVTAGKSV